MRIFILMKNKHIQKKIFNHAAQDSFHELIIASNDSPMIKAVHSLLQKHTDIQD